MEVAVVGAGVVGSAVAASLARSGARVTLLEAHRPAAGTSGTTFAWVNANNKQPLSYHRLNLAGVDEHHARAADYDGSFHPSGHLEVADTEEHATRLREKVARLRDWGYPVAELDRRQVEDRVSGLVPWAAATAAAWYPAEGYCDVSRFVAAALRAVRRAGGVLRRATVRRVQPRSSAAEVQLDDGSVARFDKVVVAAGRHSEQLLGDSGPRLPLHASRAPGSAVFGFLTTTHPVPLAVDSVLTTSRLSVRPEGHGRLLLQALDLDAEAHPDLPPETMRRVAGEMARRLEALFELSYPAPVAPAVVGTRVLPADGLTASGYVDPGERLYVAVTHSGVTLAPLLGRLVATELHGESAALLRDFRPARFGTGTEAEPPAPARRPGEQ